MLLCERSQYLKTIGRGGHYRYLACQDSHNLTLPQQRQPCCEVELHFGAVWILSASKQSIHGGFPLGYKFLSCFTCPWLGFDDIYALGRQTGTYQASKNKSILIDFLRAPVGIAMLFKSQSSPSLACNVKLCCAHSPGAHL